MSRVSGIIETTLYVKEMQPSVEFYQRLFDFATLHASERLTALRVAPGQVLLLMKEGASAEPSVMSFGVIPPSDAAGEQHVAFGVPPEELDRWRDTLQRYGIAIESAFDWPDGGHSIYFRDPDNHCIEVKTSDWDGEPLPSVSSSPSA